MLVETDTDRVGCAGGSLAATPFDWTFGRDDLDKLCARLARPPHSHPAGPYARSVTIPDPTRWRLEQRLNLRRRQRWPALRELKVRYRADYAYVTGRDDDGELQLSRLRYAGSLERWGFACYLASKDRYEDSVLPTGAFTGTPEEALDCACGLYLNDPAVWSEAQPADHSRGNF